MPEAEIRPSLILSQEGRIVGFNPPPVTTIQARQAITAGQRSFKHIPVRALALYGDPSTPEPWVKEAAKEATPEIQEQMAKYFTDGKEFSENLITAFEKGVPTAHVVRLSCVHHYMFITNEAEVLEEINNFINKLSLK